MRPDKLFGLPFLCFLAHFPTLYAKTPFQFQVYRPLFLARSLVMSFPRPLQARFSINLDLSPAHHVRRWAAWPNSYKRSCSRDSRWSCGKEIHWMWNSIFRAIKDRSIRSVSVRWAPPSCPHQAGFERITNSRFFCFCDFQLSPAMTCR